MTTRERTRGHGTQKSILSKSSGKGTEFEAAAENKVDGRRIGQWFENFM